MTSVDKKAIAVQFMAGTSLVDVAAFHCVTRARAEDVIREGFRRAVDLMPAAIEPVEDLVDGDPA